MKTITKALSETQFKLVLEDGEIWFYCENNSIVQEIIKKVLSTTDKKKKKILSFVSIL